jgi:uncharacterized integral membrane protein (TIGR00697 family)
MGLGALRLGRCALVTNTALQCVIANLFVTKQIMLFGLNVTCADVFIVGSGLSLSMLQEFFGEEEAKKAVSLSFFFLVCFLILSQFQMAYVPSQFDNMHSNFYSILSFMPRVTLASIVAYLTAQSVSILVFKFFKKIFDGKFLALRTGLTNLVSQFIDTVVFSFAALYGIAHSVTHIIFFSFLIKIAAIAIAIPFMQFAKKVFKGARIDGN